MSSGPEDAVGEAGVVLDVGGEHELPAGADALDDDRLEVGAAGVDGGGQARPGPDPTMTSSWRSGIRVLASRWRSRPDERPRDHEDSTQDQVGRPHLAA